jgi:formate hydrogenlyase subunit 6/NADH:ubiquinone oxidoreductase subunit I
LNLKLFSNGESHEQWPSKTRAFAIKPDPEVQQVKISCIEGEQICWGAWMTVQEVSGEVGAGGHRNTKTYKINWGVGERGVRTCSYCCDVCKDGMLSRVMRLGDAKEINAR